MTCSSIDTQPRGTEHLLSRHLPDFFEDKISRIKDNILTVAGGLEGFETKVAEEAPG